MVLASTPMFKKQSLTPFFIIIISTLLLSVTMFRSGLTYSFGIGFWGPNGHDGIWHLSLINQLQKHLPPQNPVFSDEKLINYHWGFDLFAAFFAKIFHLDNSLVYFQILPVLFSLLLGVLSYTLAKKITKNNKIAIWFTLFTYFSGSFGWIYTIIKTGQLGGESLFWSMQSVSTLINPPYVLSLIVLLFGLLFWYRYQNQNRYVFAIINGLIFGLLSGIKIYAGILIGLSLVTFWLINFIKTKKIINYTFFTWLTTLIISLIILSLLGILNNSSVLEFKPLWFVHSMIESIDKFYLPKLASYRLSLAQNLTFIKLPLFIALEFSLILVFFIGNIGLRLLGFPLIFQKIKKHQVSPIENIFLIIMFYSFIVPLLFVQKGTAWNTIQFFYYFLFITNFFFAQFITKLNFKNKVNYFSIPLIFIAANITSYTSLKDYFGNPPPSNIPTQEISALNFLKQQSDGIVLTYPYDKYLKNNFKKTPIPIFAYETTAYVSAYTHKNVFLEDEMNLDITGFNWQHRRDLSQQFFTSINPFFARGFLVDNQINYIYLVENQLLPLDESSLQIDKIFDNSYARIYKVQR